MTNLSRRGWLDPAWFEAPDHPQRAPGYELAVIAVMFLWNVIANLVVPDAAASVVVATGAILLLVIARRSGSTWDQLGLGHSSMGAGVRLGVAAVGVVTAAIVVASVVPASRGLLADDRFVGVAAGEMLREVFLRIPLVTAVGEEVAFRGVLLGLLLTRYSPFRAAVLTSALFGLWHVLPGVDALETTAAEFSAGLMGVVAVSGQVLVTGFAGMAFAWLRLRSGSLAAPVLVHWGLNGAAYLAGWLVVENSWA
ncbi:MAG: CPBP family intramembrane metalloprotease [Acidimicrobiia bacterium]|nr:CPBP family intramembrane metalloprotease [Acidimicrobiia bacterium]